MTSKLDYKVARRCRQDIAALALWLRQGRGNEDDRRFCIVGFLEQNWREVTGSSTRSIILVCTKDNEKPAWVDFYPTRLYIDREVYSLAKNGDPDSIYIIAHEMGHLCMHDHLPIGFTAEPRRYMQWVEEEESAEWQAHCFARYFLFPVHMIVNGIDDWELAALSNIPTHVVSDVVNECTRNPLINMLKLRSCINCGWKSNSQIGKQFTCARCGISN